MEPDGYTTQIGLPNVLSGEYYLHVFHRNHKHIISSAKLTMNSLSDSVYDFTVSSDRYYNEQGCVSVGSERWAQQAGDLDHDHDVDLDDFLIWYNQAKNGLSGYRISDINGDGMVTTRDYQYWYNAFYRNSPEHGF
ncbi:MAG: hypothetical protein U5R06_01955 [candidate division KSB1 bacterium]|nr:hypothetical protein [candidate division KSB1 bacterium]